MAPGLQFYNNLSSPICNVSGHLLFLLDPTEDHVRVALQCRCNFKCLLLPTVHRCAVCAAMGTANYNCYSQESACVACDSNRAIFANLVENGLLLQAMPQHSNMLHISCSCLGRMQTSPGLLAASGRALASTTAGCRRSVPPDCV